MSATLPAGCYFGRTLRRWEGAGLILSETAYPTGASVPSHSHQSAYLCLIRQGHYVETFGSSSRECGPRTLAVHPPQERHAERILSAVRSFNLEIPAQTMRRLPGVGGALREPRTWRGGPPVSLALRLYQEFRDPDEFSPLVVEGVLLEILAAVLRSARPESRQPAWLRRVEERVRERYAEKLTLSELAEEAGVHPVHLATVFRQKRGVTVGEFIRRLRVAAAEALLSEQARSLAEIALAVGFADQSHFTRTFRRIHGMTPNAYRRLLGTS